MADKTTADGTTGTKRGSSTASIPTKTLKKNDEGEDVERLFSYLKQFGYFPNDALRAGNALFRPAVPFAPADTSRFGDEIEGAVRKFQQQQGLEVTGKLDDTTLSLMQQPRCGFPDQPVGGNGAANGAKAANGTNGANGGAPAPFVAQGNKWSSNTVSYHFDNFTPDLSQAQCRAAIKGAYDRWAAVTPLTFNENPAGGDMRIAWRSGDHGDGSSFDGPSHILAHCFYPPPNGGDIAGDCHFDEAETWSVNTPPSGIDLATVALHELGHGLGLAHSNDPNSVMYAYYGGPRRELTTDDIQGIQTIYGSKFRWASRGGAIFNPVVSSNQDGRMEVFARGTDGALWHIWQTAPNNGWSGWASMGGGIQGPIAVGQNADGRMEVFVRGTDGALWHIWQTAPSNGWSGWASLGGSITDPVVGRNANGALEVFARGTDGALWHRRQSGGGWTPWSSLGGGMASQVSVSNNLDGRLEVFVRGTDGALWHTWQTAPSSTTWGGWASRGGVIQGAPVVSRNKDGRLEVFGKGTDNALWHLWQTAPNNGWSGWATLGGIISNPVVGTNADGRMEVFVKGSDNAVWHMWQTAPSNGWSGWSSLGGGLTEGPIVGRNKDGRLEMFVKGTDAALWHAWQSSPGGAWA